MDVSNAQAILMSNRIYNRRKCSIVWRLRLAELVKQRLRMANSIRERIDNTFEAVWRARTNSSSVL